MTFQPEFRPKAARVAQPPQGTAPLRPFLPLLALLLALLSPVNARADSQAGREFWFAWPETADASANDPGYDLDSQVVILAPTSPVTVQVTGPGLSTSVSASPGSPGFVRLSRATTMMSVADTPVARGVHLVSTNCAPFAAFLRVPGSSSSVADDMARLMPVDMLGTRYLPVAYRGQANFVVCATQDGTRVRIIDPHCASPPEMILARGEAILHRCAAQDVNQDVTGTIVDASAPIAVLSGSAASQVIFQALGGFGQTFWEWQDVLLDAPWPEDLLGRRYAHAPFRQQGGLAPGDLVRLVAACPGTSATIVESDGDTWNAPLLVEGSYFDAQQAAAVPAGYQLVNTASEMSGDHPFEAAAFTVGGSKAGIGDPSMAMLDPEERWEPQALVYLPPDYSGSLSVIAPTGATASVRVDGAAPSGTWANVGTSGRLRWLRIDDLPEGEHRVTCDAPIFVELAGYSTRLDHEAGAFSTPAVALRADGLPTARVGGAWSCEAACARTCASLAVQGTWQSIAWEDGLTGAAREWCPSATGDLEAMLTSVTGCRSVARAHRDVKGRPDLPSISGPGVTCAGDCVDLTASSGWASYRWNGGATSATLNTCPSATTTYTVTTTDDVGCSASVDHVVTVIARPVPGPATVATIAPCRRGLVISWAAATWRAGSPGGAYNVYRRAGSCVAPGDPTWALLAMGLPGLSFTDSSAQVGIAYSYLVEAEDAPAGGCAPGPFMGGPTASACATPENIVDPGDPDEARLITLSPYLRASGYERVGPSGPCTAVTFSWALAPALDPATHAEIWRSDRPDMLAPLERNAVGASWRDPDPTGAWLYFYKVFNASDCGSVREP